MGGGKIGGGVLRSRGWRRALASWFSRSCSLRPPRLSAGNDALIRTETNCEPTRSRRPTALTPAAHRVAGSVRAVLRLSTQVGAGNWERAGRCRRKVGRVREVGQCRGDGGGRLRRRRFSRTMRSSRPAPVSGWSRCADQVRDRPQTGAGHGGRPPRCPRLSGPRPRSSAPFDTGWNCARERLRGTWQALRRMGRRGARVARCTAEMVAASASSVSRNTLSSWPAPICWQPCADPGQRRPRRRADQRCRPRLRRRTLEPYSHTTIPSTHQVGNTPRLSRSTAALSHSEVSLHPGPHRPRSVDPLTRALARPSAATRRLSPATPLVRQRAARGLPAPTPAPALRAGGWRRGGLGRCGSSCAGGGRRR